MVHKTKGIGLFVLAVYLILVGVVGLFAISFQGLNVILSLLALVSGVLLLVGLVQCYNSCCGGVCKDDRDVVVTKEDRFNKP